MPAPLTADQVEDRLRRVRLVSFDVDGVMTGGGLYYDEGGREMRCFNVRDGVAIKALMAHGIAVAFLTSSRTKSIDYRAKALGVPHCLLGVENKLAALEKLCEELGVALEDVAHMGDDVNDLPVLARVGCPISVADADETVRTAALLVTGRRGGDAAVREACVRLLAARGLSL
jgi:3-deoxy-D-manno-octulosonate 8-phosphate phosphatase (KDO 8-P phosphatase)